MKLNPTNSQLNRFGQSNIKVKTQHKQFFLPVLGQTVLLKMDYFILIVVFLSSS
jgi:hypothetical protein